MLPPGASSVTGQETVPTFASLIAMSVSVTSPTFITSNVYGIVELAVLPEAVPACLVMLMPGDASTGVSVLSVLVTGSPCGGSAETLAVLATCPASTSTCVSV